MRQSGSSRGLGILVASILVAACLWLLFGQQGDGESGALDPANDRTPAATDVAQEVDHGAIARQLPNPQRPRPIDTVRSHWPSVSILGGGWEKHLAAINESDRQLLRDLNALYGGALYFDSEREQRFLMEIGFPMPEEWLAARDLSDEDLIALWELGDHKAGYFYADRLLSEIERLQRRYAAQPNDDLGNELVDARQRLIASGADPLQSRGSDASLFSAYQLGRRQSAYSGSHEPTIAAMMLASDLGDFRVRDMFMRYEQLLGLQGRTSSTYLIYLSYDLMRRELLRNPVLRMQFYRSVESYPSSSH